jgi:hypothetical protein
MSLSLTVVEHFGDSIETFKNDYAYRRGYLPCQRIPAAHGQCLDNPGAYDLMRLFMMAKAQFQCFKALKYFYLQSFDVVIY